MSINEYKWVNRKAKWQRSHKYSAVFRRLMPWYPIHCSVRDEAAKPRTPPLGARTSERHQPGCESPVQDWRDSTAPVSRGAGAAWQARGAWRRSELSDGLAELLTGDIVAARRGLFMFERDNEGKKLGIMSLVGNAWWKWLRQIDMGWKDVEVEECKSHFFAYWRSRQSRSDHNVTCQRRNKLSRDLFGSSWLLCDDVTGWTHPKVDFYS